jgi:hypothetical protein
MAQTHDGAMKIAAKRAGISLRAFEARVARGEKWCVGHKAFHPRTGFGQDVSRYDGLASSCIEWRRDRYRSSYVSQATGAPKGPPAAAPRTGDKRQARRRINVLVRSGRLARPNSLPCFDCGHVCKKPVDKRHEYDHYLGYSREHHYDVQAVCTNCHAKRAVARGERSTRRTTK